MALKIKLRQSGSSIEGRPLFITAGLGAHDATLEMATGTVITIRDAFSGFYVETELGPLAIIHRDGGILVTDEDGKELWSSVHGVPEPEPDPYPFQQYARTPKRSLLRPYVSGEPMEGIMVSKADAQAGSPKIGDMIARNPENHEDQWLVSAKYFAANFEPNPV